MPFTPKTKLSCCDRSNRVPYVTKTKQDNDVINCTSATYSKNDTEPSWPIRLGANCDENQIGKLRDRLYRCGLCQKWNWASMIDQTKSDLWWKLDWSYGFGICLNWNSTVETYTGCGLGRKQDKTTMWSIVPVRSTLNTCIYLFTYLFLPQKLSFFLWHIKPPLAYSLVHSYYSS